MSTPNALLSPASRVAATRLIGSPRSIHGSSWHDADNDFGWTSLLAGAASPDLIASGKVTIRRESLQDDIRTRGDRALADIPGLSERLEIEHVRKLWPGQVTVRH
jgi:hypothetical protein